MKITKEHIDDTLKHLLESSPKGRLKEAMTYALLNGGKRLRPLLMLAVIEAYGLNPELYIETACSLEMIHAYSLVHDDLPAMDDDDLRRGKPTTHKAFDEATAILAGDALITDAFLIVTRQDILSEQTKVNIISVLAHHAGSHGMVYGQMLDLLAENTKIDLEDLKRIHTHKTGKLIEAALMMASYIAKPEDLDAWQSIGANLGLAFQIQDDVMEITHSQEAMGKSLSDDKNQKTTYVGLLGLEESNKCIDKAFETIHLVLSNLTINREVIDVLLTHIQNRKN